ncbi:MAG: hypothetical protein AVDCRST_MAG89-1488, partial [uncultured Gemmatimonadetes bacterium]
EGEPVCDGRGMRSARGLRRSDVRGCSPGPGARRAAGGSAPPGVPARQLQRNRDGGAEGDPLGSRVAALLDAAVGRPSPPAPGGGLRSRDGGGRHDGRAFHGRLLDPGGQRGGELGGAGRFRDGAFARTVLRHHAGDGLSRGRGGGPGQLASGAIPRSEGYEGVQRI